MIYEALEQLLREVLIDVQERHVSFSLGDLFEASHFRLQDVFLKTDTFNMLHLPLALAAGYVGDFKIEGLVGAVAGAPLSLRVRNVCLVLRHTNVQWDNELLLRFAKEFTIALWQSVLVPNYEGKPTANSSSSSGSAFISPGKWIASRIQAAVAEMTVTMENIHIRIENEHDEASIAYGVHIPVLRLNTRATDDQILHRRKQVGVDYPKASATASKLLALENPALYCDVSPERYWYDPLRPSSMENSLLRFRECALRGLPRDARRDVCSASVIWLKLDLQRQATVGDSTTATGGGGGISLAAIDIVTEGLKVDVDFDQLAAFVNEMESVKAFQTRQKMRQWRPSAVDRARVTPPTASVRSDALFPALPADLAALVAPRDKQKRSSQWFRAMWRYAARCVLLQLRKGDERRVRLYSETHGKRQSHYDRQRERNARRDRYMHLYTRSLNKTALELVLRGRAALVSALRSPRKTATPPGAGPSSIQPPMASNAAFTFPDLPPLTPEERWELSDLVWTLPVHDQRVYRAVADHALRQEYEKRSAPPSPTRKISLGTPSSVAAGNADATATPPPSPPKSPQFPLDFVANHHRITRSATEGAMGVSPASSPPLARVHAASTTALLGKSSRGERSPTAASPNEKPTKPRAPISKQEWFQQTFFPKWVTGKNALPLINWSLGAISIALCRPKSATSSSNSATTAASRSSSVYSAHLPEVVDDVIYEDKDGVSRPPRDVLVEIRIESCSGAVLLTKTSTIRALAELRVGLVHATLLDSRNPERRTIHRHPSSGLVETSSSPPRFGGHRRNWISTDYIREPADGFFYVGLKYNAKELPAVSSTSLLSCDVEEWDVKGRVCVGTINIEYHEDIVGAHHKLSAATASPTYTSVLSDVCSTCTVFLSQMKLRSAKYWSFDAASATGCRGKAELDDEVKHTDGYVAVSTVIPPRLTFAAAVEKWSEAKRASVIREAKCTRFLNALLLHASTLEADLGGIQLTASVPTCRVQSALRSDDSLAVNPIGTEQFQVEIAPTTLKLQNRPQLDECLVEGAGMRAVYHSTKQGRAAAIQFLSQKLNRR